MPSFGIELALLSLPCNRVVSTRGVFPFHETVVRWKEDSVALAKCKRSVPLLEKEGLGEILLV